MTATLKITVDTTADYTRTLLTHWGARFTVPLRGERLIEDIASLYGNGIYDSITQGVNSVHLAGNDSNGGWVTLTYTKN